MTWKPVPSHARARRLTVPILPVTPERFCLGFFSPIPPRPPRVRIAPVEVWLREARSAKARPGAGQAQGRGTASRGPALLLQRLLPREPGGQAEGPCQPAGTAEAAAPTCAAGPAAGRAPPAPRENARPPRPAGALPASDALLRPAHRAAQGGAGLPRPRPPQRWRRSSRACPPSRWPPAPPLGGRASPQAGVRPLARRRRRRGALPACPARGGAGRGGAVAAGSCSAERAAVTCRARQWPRWERRRQDGGAAGRSGARRRRRRGRGRRRRGRGRSARAGGRRSPARADPPRRQPPAGRRRRDAAGRAVTRGGRGGSRGGGTTTCAGSGPAVPAAGGGRRRSGAPGALPMGWGSGGTGAGSPRGQGGSAARARDRPGLSVLPRGR